MSDSQTSKKKTSRVRRWTVTSSWSNGKAPRALRPTTVEAGTASVALGRGVRWIRDRVRELPKRTRVEMIVVKVTKLGAAPPTETGGS